MRLRARLGSRRLASGGFSFQALPYTQEELASKRHNHELVPCGSTVVCLDYGQAGIGSNSCGPHLKDEYRLSAERFSLALSLAFRSAAEGEE